MDIIAAPNRTTVATIDEGMGLPHSSKTAGQPPKLYCGERFETVEGHPCIYKYIPPCRKDPASAESKRHLPDQDLPLVVLIPGGAHNARIYYGGHEGYHATDYMASWLSHLGFPVLAISYPLESEPPLMPPVSPHLRIHTWGRQAASVTHSVVQEQASLAGRDILLVGWSMGGRIVAPFTEAATKLGLRVGLFVSLAATAGVAGLRPPPPGIVQTTCGYATCDGLVDLFIRQIRGILPAPVFRAEYFGHTPVSLHGWRMSYDAATDALVEDRWESETDAAPSADDFSLLPWLATIVGTESVDARHVLIDRAAWDYINVQRLTSIWEKHVNSLPDRRSNSSTNGGTEALCFPGDETEFSARHTALQCRQAKSVWDAYSSFVLETVRGALNRSVPGNHYFFLGAEGAQKTADAIAQLWRERCTLDRELESILATRSS